MGILLCYNGFIFYVALGPFRDVGHGRCPFLADRLTPINLHKQDFFSGDIFWVRLLAIVGRRPEIEKPGVRLWV